MVPIWLGIELRAGSPLGSEEPLVE
jgi:hypothetical protein